MADALRRDRARGLAAARGRRSLLFLELFRLWPGAMLEPTPDVDLIWHMHQPLHTHCKPRPRRKWGLFADHDDELALKTPEPGMDQT